MADRLCPVGSVASLPVGGARQSNAPRIFAAHAASTASKGEEHYEGRRWPSQGTNADRGNKCRISTTGRGCLRMAAVSRRCAFMLSRSQLLEGSWLEQGAAYVGTGMLAGLRCAG